MTELQLICLLSGFVTGLLIGGWLVGYKFASNANEPMRLEWKGRIYKVYDVTELRWHIEPENYERYTEQDRMVFLRKVRAEG